MLLATVIEDKSDLNEDNFMQLQNMYEPFVNVGMFIENDDNFLQSQNMYVPLVNADSSELNFVNAQQQQNI